MKKHIVILFCLMACLAFAAEPVRRRGKLIREEITSTDKQETFSVEMLQDTSFMPTLRFTRIQTTTTHYIKLYETLMEVVKPPVDGDFSATGNVEYVPIPNEYTQGEPYSKTKIIIQGPLTNTQLTVNGVKIYTDSHGIFVDYRQWLLDEFDVLSRNQITLTCSHPTLGTQKLKITRRMIKTENTRPAENKQQLDLLENMKLDFTQLRSSSTDGLKTTLLVPPSGLPGHTVPVTIQVSNEGTLPVSNLMARMFCSLPELNGKTFYFGRLQPGAKATFSRMVKLPDKACFGTIAFWSALGPSPEHNLSFALQDPKKL